MCVFNSRFLPSIVDFPPGYTMTGKKLPDGIAPSQTVIVWFRSETEMRVSAGKIPPDNRCLRQLMFITVPYLVHILVYVVMGINLYNDLYKRLSVCVQRRT